MEILTGCFPVKISPDILRNIDYMAGFKKNYHMISNLPYSPHSYFLINLLLFFLYLINWRIHPLIFWRKIFTKFWYISFRINSVRGRVPIFSISIILNRWVKFGFCGLSTKNLSIATLDKQFVFSKLGICLEKKLS